MSRGIASLIVFLFAVSLQCSCVFAQTTPRPYVGAVAEHNPVSDPAPTPLPIVVARSIMFTNLAVYRDYMEEAKAQAADIVVFPEHGLYGAQFANRDCLKVFLEDIPDPQATRTAIIPCNNTEYTDRPVLQSLSCMAMKYATYIVVNMGDVKTCPIPNVPACPSDGRYQFNTQVAFSRTGQLLNRYHKSHPLTDELRVWNYPITGDNRNVRTFDTDFGVKFGMMIGADILFEHPSQDLIAAGVKNFAYSTYWDNAGMAPAITANVAQQSFSFATSTNLLASNVAVNGTAHSGSGIFSEGNPLEVWYNDFPNNVTKVLATTVPLTQPSKTLFTSHKKAVTSRTTTPRHAVSVPHSSAHVRQSSRIPAKGDTVPTAINLNELISLPNANVTMMNTQYNGKVEATSTNSRRPAGSPPLRCQAWWVRAKESRNVTESWALVAYDGLYFGGRLELQICAIQRCVGPPTAASCMAFSTRSGVGFQSIMVNAALVKDHVVNFGVLGDNGSLFPPTEWSEWTTTSATQTTAQIGMPGKPGAQIGQTVVNMMVWQQTGGRRIKPRR